MCKFKLRPQPHHFPPQANIPTAIIRPSIVEGAAREPLSGWMEGIRMMDPLVLAYGRGKMGGFPMER